MADEPAAATTQSARGLDRSRDAASVVARIHAARGRVVVLSGKADSGKTDFIRMWVMPILGEGAVYADCASGIPFALTREASSSRAPLARPEVLVLDSIDRLLRAPGRATRDELERVLLEGSASVVVLVTTEQSLG